MTAINKCVCDNCGTELELKNVRFSVTEIGTHTAHFCNRTCLKAWVEEDEEQ